MARLRTLGPQTRRSGVKKPYSKPQKAANALRGTALSVVRKGTPFQIGCLLKEMEKKREIYSDVTADSDDDMFAKSDLAEEQTDCDFDFSDEDDFGTDDAINEGQTSVSGDGRWHDAYSAFDESKSFELRFCESDGRLVCKITKDPRSGCFSDLPVVMDTLNELAHRYDVLEHIGNWLADNRRAFLRSGDFWDYAEQALQEAEKKGASILQKDFIAIAGLNCTEAAFSDFIKHAVLSFESGENIPISRLFSQPAKCAWVARAFRDMCRHSKLDMDKSVQDLQTAKAYKENRNDRARKSLGSMGRKEAAALLCEIAGIGGATVVESYGAKIKEVQDGNQ